MQGGDVPAAWAAFRSMNVFQKLFCKIGRCLACVPKDDDTGCWGECIRCGRRHGFVSRADLRSYLDREERRKRLFPDESTAPQ
jgi:hypothetical protein